MFFLLFITLLLVTFIVCKKNIFLSVICNRANVTADSCWLVVGNKVTISYLHESYFHNIQILKGLFSLVYMKTIETCMIKTRWYLCNMSIQCIRNGVTVALITHFYALSLHWLFLSSCSIIGMQFRLLPLAIDNNLDA